MDVAADSRAVTDAVIGLLEAAGLTVGDGVAETASGAALTPPYAVVYPVSDVLSGPVASVSADADRTVQVTYVGVSREQAQWAADKGAVALLGADHRAVTVAGRALTGSIRHGGGGGVLRDDDTAGPPLFYAPQRYVVPTTPA